MSYETRQSRKTGQQMLGFVRSDKPPVSPKPRRNVKVINEAEKLNADPLVSPTSEKMEDKRPKCSCETSTKVIELKIDQLLDRFIQIEETIGKKISASLYIYHFSTVIDFSSEKYSGSTGQRNSWYQ